MISLRTFLFFLILFIISLIVLLIVSAVTRRAWKGWRYANLDRLRAQYTKTLAGAIDSGTLKSILSDLAARPKSMKWRAIEDVLLSMVTREKYAAQTRELFAELGYAAFYEKQMGKKDIIEQATSIDKLGRMASPSSIPRLIAMLDSERGEAVSAAIKALCRMNSLEGMRTILERLPAIMGKANVSQRVVETSLVKFGTAAVPAFVEHAKKYGDQISLQTILDVLAIVQSREALPFILECLDHKDGDVRATALKAVITTALDIKGFIGKKVVRLTQDPEWYVRLHAARVLGELRYAKELDSVGRLLVDSNWHVRNAAVTALTKMGNASLDVFLKTLKSQQADFYVVGSICEEIERSLFVFRLFENLKSEDQQVRQQSREILEIMYSIDFFSPFLEYMTSGSDAQVKNEISKIISADKGTVLS
jgi:HEAT repeat protein